MALSRFSENRLNKARRFGDQVKPIKPITPIKPINSIKSPNRRISFEAGKTAGNFQGKPIIIIDARKSPQRVIKHLKKTSISKSLAELVAKYERDQEKPTRDYNIVPTRKRIFPNTIEFAFKCEKKQWTAVNLTIDKFDMTNGGMLIGEPVIQCEEEEDCVCQARCRCPNPQWVTTNLKCDGTFVQQSHHGDPDEESSYKKNGKHLISIKPCGSEECKVCEGAEIVQDDVEIYNFDL
jgi:hypothetical protein